MLKKIVRVLVRGLKHREVAMSETTTLGVAAIANQETTGTSIADKRSCDRGNDDTENETAAKKMKAGHDDEPAASTEPYKPFKKKKMVIFLVYSGKDYLGMQRNPGAKTIESDLVEALLKAGVVNEEHAANPGPKMHFQRAARTDKGVSAAGQICSLNMFIDVENPMEKINSHLVDQIRVIGLQKVTKKFDSKNAANARTYMYMIPTFAFTPCEQFVLETFKINDDIQMKVNETLALFKGTHNFHNFTSGKKPSDPSARRYIIDFSMGPAFVRDDIEFAVITVKGQSFMLHQIRKMIGLTIAIVRGLTGPEAVERAYGPDKCDIPKAPGLGLVLDKVHYDFYNRKYGTDGLHEPIAWEKYQETIEKFKEDFIYRTIIDTERTEKSMLKWMSTLHLHHFEPRDANKPTGIGQAENLVRFVRKNATPPHDIDGEGTNPDNITEDITDTVDEVKLAEVCTGQQSMESRDPEVCTGQQAMESGDPNLESCDEPTEAAGSSPGSEERTADNTESTGPS